MPANRSAYLLIVLRQTPRFSRLGLGSAANGAPATGGISVNAIAASFRQPFETARRHINALIAQGLCYRNGNRVFIAPDRLESPAFEMLLGTIHDAMVRLVDDCRAAGIGLPEPRSNAAYHPDTTVAVAIDLMLAVYEYAAPNYSSWLQLRVLSATFCANTRRLVLDPKLAEQHDGGDTLPPESALAPITGRAIARAIRLPYPTVRRQIDTAIKQGWLVRGRGGVHMSHMQMAGPSAAELDRAGSSRAIKAFERLAPVGFRFDHPANHYEGRTPPPPLDFD